MIVTFLFIVTVLEINCLYQIVSVLKHTIYSFSFSRSKSFRWLVIILYMYLYCCGGCELEYCIVKCTYDFLLGCSNNALESTSYFKIIWMKSDSVTILPTIKFILYEGMTGKGVLPPLLWKTKKAWRQIRWPSIFKQELKSSRFLKFFISKSSIVHY